MDITKNYSVCIKCECKQGELTQLTCSKNGKSCEVNALNNDCPQNKFLIQKMNLPEKIEAKIETNRQRCGKCNKRGNQT
jgi:hypothetical protein